MSGGLEARLWEAAAMARDVLEHSRAERWEFFAKASRHFEITARGGRSDRLRRVEETGVAVRTLRAGRSGFAAGSGLGVDAARRAVDGAASAARPVATDPLPPDHLLTTVDEVKGRPAVDEDWLRQALAEIGHSLREIGGDRLEIPSVAARAGRFGAILAGSGGFVAGWGDAAAELVVELRLPGSARGTWRERCRLPGPEDFDARRVAAALTSRALLTLARTTADQGLKDLLLHPEVSAHLLAALAPVLLVMPPDDDPLPRLLDRHGALAARAITLVDTRIDPDGPWRAPCDGEGLGSARTLLVEEGVPRHRTGCYRDAVATGDAPRGGAVRVSYRDPPRSGLSGLRLETGGGCAPAQLLEQAGRALYLLRPLAPVECDLAADSYRIVASGVWLDRGAVVGWHPVVELRGGLGRLLRRISAVGTDRTWYDTPAGPVGASSLLVRRQPVLG